MADPDVRVRLGAEGVAEVVAALKKIQTESEQSARRSNRGFTGLNSVLGETKKLLGALGVGFGAYQIVRGITAATNATKEWQQSWAEVKTIASGTEAELAGVEKRVRGLANVIPQDQTLLAQGFYQTLSSGITDAEEALTFLELAAQAAVGGITDTAIAVDVGTTVLNAYGKEVSETSRIFDVLFGTVQAGKINFEQLSGNLGKVIPIAAQAGFSLEEVTAAIATMTKGGLSAEEATTALRATFVALLKPQEQAAQYAKDLDLEYSAQAASAKGLVPWLKEVADKTGGNAAAQAKLFPEVKAMTAVMGLAGNQWQEYSDILGFVTNQVDGVSRAAFETVTDSMISQEQILKNRLKNAWLDMGDTVEGVSNALLAVAGGLLPQSFEEQAQAIERTRRQIERIDRDGKRLTDTYEKLVAESDGSEESQRKIEAAMRDLAEAFPEVISQVDAMGNATGIATDRLWEYRDALQAVLDMETRKAFQEQVESARSLTQQLEAQTESFNALSAARDRLEERRPDERFRRAGRPGGRGETYGTEGPAGLLGKEYYDEQLKAFRQAMATIEVDLTATGSKLATTLIKAGLAEQVVELNALAEAEAKGYTASGEFEKALDGVGSSLRTLLDTTDPNRIRSQLQLWSEALRRFDPELSFLGPTAGPALPPAEAPAPAQAPQAKAYAEDLKLLKANLKAREAEEKLAYENRELAATDYYTNLRTIRTEAHEAEAAELQRQLAATKGAEDPAKASVEAAKLRNELALEQLEYETDIAALQIQEAVEIKRLGGERLKIEDLVLEAQGRRHEIALREIDELAQRYDAVLKGQQVPGADRERLVANLRAAQEAKLSFQEAKEQAEAALADYEITAAMIQADVKTGILEQAQGHEQLRQLEAERLEGLQKLVAALMVAAIATKDPEALAAAKELALALKQIQGAGDEAASSIEGYGKRINDVLVGGLADFINMQGRALDSTLKLKNVFRDSVNSMVSDLRRLATQALAAQIFKGFIGLFSGGGEVVAAAGGGLLRGPGTWTSDSIPILASTGEFVVQASVVAQPGILQHLQELNRFGRGVLVPEITTMDPHHGYADGGLVGERVTPASQGSLDGKLLIGLDEGLILKALETPAAQRIQIRNTAATRRAHRSALGM